MSVGAEDPFEVMVMPGEGIGPEILAEAVALLGRLSRSGGLNVNVHELEVGQPAYEKTGEYLPEEIRDLIDAHRTSSRAAILFGACADEPIGILRKQCDLFANLRPIQSSRVLLEVSPLKPRVAAGVDMMIVRELVSGIYYGRSSQGEIDGERWAAQEMWYSEGEARRLLRLALQLAARRRKKVTFVHKGNVIKGVFNLWREVLAEEHRNFPEVEVEELHVDNMAMQMMLRPTSFDVVATTNLFGDILSEVGAGVLGSLGLVPSASLNASGFALYEPVGGTAPEIAGRGIANPIAAILSVAMMCQYTFERPELAVTIHRAVDTVLKRHRTVDIAHPACATVSTHEMGTLICDAFDAWRAGAMIAKDGIG